LAEIHAGSVLNKYKTVIRYRMENYLALRGIKMLMVAVCELVREPLFFFTQNSF